MIEVHSWPTPNGHKVHLMLEECGLPYAVHAVDITAGDQFEPGFLAISPNNRIPAIVDPDGPDGRPMALFESGAILVYLAAKCGRFLPASDRGRFETLQWLMWQVGGIGPMFGQATHFRTYAPEPVPYAQARYDAETRRLYRVLDTQLARTGMYVVGDEYTIADIAVFPWVRVARHHGVDLADYPQVRRWHDAVAARPAVRRALDVLADRRRPVIDDDARSVLFGERQAAGR